MCAWEKDYRIDLVGGKRKCPVSLKRNFSFALVQSTVQQDLFAVMVDQMH